MTPSVRQLADEAGEINLRRDYKPFGELDRSAGDGVTNFGFTGEWGEGYVMDGETCGNWNGIESYDCPIAGPLYLRARHYAPHLGRFLSRDAWEGDDRNPLALNRWNYVEANSVNFTDPSGFISQSESIDADGILNKLEADYGVIIPKDYGEGLVNPQGYGLCGIKWFSGAWNSLDELKWTKQAIEDSAYAMGGPNKFKSASMGQITIIRRNVGPWNLPIFGIQPRAFAPPFGSILGDIQLPNYIFLGGNTNAKYGIVHELGHVWDRREGLSLSNDMSVYLGTLICAGMAGCHFDIWAGVELPPGSTDKEDNYAATGIMEDWAEAFASTIYPWYYGQADPNDWRRIGPKREQFVKDQISRIP